MRRRGVPAIVRRYGTGGSSDRIEGLRCNASARSHAELDEATELDEGDPRQLVTAQDRLRPQLPNLSIIGGCCGTDARHIASLWHADQPAVRIT